MQTSDTIRLKQTITTKRQQTYDTCAAAEVESRQTYDTCAAAEVESR